MGTRRSWAGIGNAMPAPGWRRVAWGGVIVAGIAVTVTMVTRPASSGAAGPGTHQALSSTKGAMPTLPGAAPPTLPTAGGGAKIEESAAVTLRSADALTTIRRLEALAGATGGYVAASSLTGTGRRASAMVTLMIPAGRLDRAVGAITRMGRVTALSESGVNVTNTWNNLTLQLAALTSEAAAYRRLYARATRIADLLRIQQALSAVDAAITADRQQLAGIDRAVTYAAVSVTVLPVPARSRVAAPGPLLASLRTMLAVGRAALAALLWILPWAVLAGLIALPMWWRRRTGPADPGTAGGNGP
jgi:hypothetical protein